MVAVPARTMNEREWDCSPRVTGARGESLLPFRRNEDLQGFAKTVAPLELGTLS